MKPTPGQIDAGVAALHREDLTLPSKELVAKILTAALSASPAGETPLTEDQIERAEWKLAEVLAGYEYTMPVDGMRRVLTAALKGDEQ